MRIGVFDSGIGGRSIADRLEADYPDTEVLYVDDRKNVPYGSRSQEEVFILTNKAIQPLLDARCDVIVLACNTATAAAIEALRVKYPNMPFVGLEPMIKTAATLTKSGVVAICATPSTLASDRYQKLKSDYAHNVRVVEPDCNQWAAMIEHDQLDEEQIIETVEQVCAEQADVIVLACTHYHWIKDMVTAVVGDRAIVIDPSDAISSRVGTILSTPHVAPHFYNNH